MTSQTLAPIPDSRLRVLNAKDIRSGANYVLYWMITSRRTHWNYALQRAAWWSRELNKPLLVLEALRCGYRWASDRLHAFVIEGMADNRNALEKSSARYVSYVEPAMGHGHGLLETLAADSAIIVTDDFPCFFIPAMLRRAASQLDVRLESVDSNGLWPMRATDRVFHRAYDFRRFLQKNLPPHLLELPLNSTLEETPTPAWREATWKAVSKSIGKWVDNENEDSGVDGLSALPIDHTVQPASFRGGSSEGSKAMRRFLLHGLPRYADERNHPDDDVSSRLSPYLHFGHISPHQLFYEITQAESWSPSRVSESGKGAREGWWGMSQASESFLDELITWRELGYNMCCWNPRYDQYDSLPEWARATLESHQQDGRNPCYSLEQLEQADTHDPIWNAAQTELKREGRMHNYLRMLWGKKILEWSLTPQDALRSMIHLNNKYAVDGRNPNSYSGIFWVLGRYDRAWGPERPIFGKVRYMSSENTSRKLRLKEYLATYS